MLCYEPYFDSYMTDVVQKLWGFCHTLRHDGVDYGDYIEQLTYLLFLKMADERGADGAGDYDWATLKDTSAPNCSTTTPTSSASSASQPGILGDIFAEATPRFNNPVNLKRVIAHDRRGGLDLDRRGREGRRLRGLAGKGRQRRQERRGPILHPASTHPDYRPRHEARPAR